MEKELTLNKKNMEHLAGSKKNDWTSQMSNSEQNTEPIT